MKNLVPKRRFEEFKDTDPWEQRKLGEVVDFLDERRRPLESGLRKAGPYPYYGASGIIDYVNDYIFDEELILLSEDGANILDRNYRVCFMARGKYWVNNHAHVLKAKNNYYNEFICEALERLDYTKYNTGTAQPKLNQEVCRNINILIPNFDEQIQISTFFTNLDNLITLHQRKLVKLKDTKSAYLSEMFPKDGEFYPKRRFAGFTDPWEQRKLGELNFTISDGNYGELYPKSNELLCEGVPFIRVNNLINGYLVHKDLVYISPKLHAILKSGHLKEYDILITTRGEIGKIALVDNSFENANINAQICLIRTDDKMESRYLHQYLQTEISQKEIISFQTGSALKQLPKNRLNDITIVYPVSREEQVNIGTFFSNLDNLISLHQHKLEKLQALKQAYLSEMFV